MRKSEKFPVMTEFNYWVNYITDEGIIYYHSVKAKTGEIARQMFKSAFPTKDVISTWNVTTFKHDQ